MSEIRIEGFDTNRLEELAVKQTEIYNQAILMLPNWPLAKIEDIIKRFKRETFDQSRMFYAYDGDRMVGYSGLTGKDNKKNLRGIGYPWLVEGTDEKVRDDLYGAMEKKCREEGTKELRVFGSPRYPDQLNFFKSKQFETTIEFLVHEKVLEKNDFELLKNYVFRSLKREDFPKLEEVSKNDPKLKSPFVASDWDQWLNSVDYDPKSVVIAEKENEVVGLYGTYYIQDPNDEKAYFAGVVVHGDHQEIEPYLIMEMENRALKKGKKKFQTTFFPDSPRLPYAKEFGYVQTETSYELRKEL